MGTQERGAVSIGGKTQMSDEAIKKRLERAKGSALKMLESTGYDTILSDNKRACLVAFRSTETRIIRVVIDKITEFDISSMRDLRTHPGICKKEIWCRKGAEFEIREC